MNLTFDAFTAALQTGGLVEALRVLNARVVQRYSAVYRLTPDRRLVNVAFVDKAGMAFPEYLRAVPYGLSFCQFTFAHGEFRTSDSSMDPRLDGHPYKGLVNSYHAVPFASDDGAVTGTISHFDMDAVPLADEEFALLRHAALVIPGFLRASRIAQGQGGSAPGA